MVPLVLPRGVRRLWRCRGLMLLALWWLLVLRLVLGLLPALVLVALVGRLGRSMGWS